jgi:cysteate synthase
MQIKKTNYLLQSIHSGKTFEDRGWMLDAPEETTPSLIRAVYEAKQISVKDDGYGLYKYADWLPVNRMLEGSSAPVTYKSEGLAKYLGLSELWITFNGFWPERGAFMKSCSFKETEAYSVCARHDPAYGKVLVVASAGNTARAFAKVCSDNHIPLLLCVPEGNLDSLWFEHPLNDCVRLVTTAKGSDYFDAIRLSNIAVSIDGFFPEGGAKNIARRDGMGTTVLSAVTTIGHIPDYYFQAVGSGTGAIAAWEANLRLIEDGRFGSNKMKLVVSQNSPFTPIFDAWERGSRDLLPMDEDTARVQANAVQAKVLTNRKPPYPPAGGLYDALIDTGGSVLKISNRDASLAGQIFEETEGIDIDPAAAVVVASLMEETKKPSFPKDAIVMLNITGGGEEQFKEGKSLFSLKPSMVFEVTVSPEEVKEKISVLFRI